MTCVVGHAQVVDRSKTSSEAGQPENGHAKIVADVAHAASPDKRTVLDHSPMGFSCLSDAFARRNSNVSINRETLRPETLVETDVLLIAAVTADKPFSAEELRAVMGFVRSGGVLLLTTNDLSREGLDAWVGLAKRFGIQSHGSAIRIVGTTPDGRSHISRYSGAGLVRWLPGIEDAWLYFHGTNAGPAGGEVLIRYNSNAFAARRRIGEGWVYAFGSGDMIGNAFTVSSESDEQDSPKPVVVNDRLIESLVEELLGISARSRRPKDRT